MKVFVAPSVVSCIPQWGHGVRVGFVCLTTSRLAHPPKVGGYRSGEKEITAFSLFFMWLMS